MTKRTFVFPVNADYPRVLDISCDVIQELNRALTLYPAMTSPHEGYAIILEELDELWEEVREKTAQHNKAAMRTEAVQIAAMAMRFILDVCDRKD